MNARLRAMVVGISSSEDEDSLDESAAVLSGEPGWVS